MNEERLTYSGGLSAMMDRYEGRRDPFDFGSESLPSLDADLKAMRSQLVPESATVRQPDAPNTSWARKRRQIAEEFVGNSQLCFLNAQLISNLRKRSYPDIAPALFRRLWAEESAHLLEHLSLRWQVSSIQTFAEHGDTPAQREAGHAFRMLFGVMKLYEFERTFSGLGPKQDFGFGKRKRVRLPLDMEPFSLKSGGLDINLLAPVWELAVSDPVMAPLADALMSELNRESGGVFRRIDIMRQKRLRQETRK